MTELSPALQWGQGFAYVGGAAFVLAGLYLSYRRGRLHPLLLVCISAISFSWIEAPYDWVVYAQFPPELPRMPAWWPMNMTWGGGLPSAVPPGYIAYFVLPAVIGAWLGRRLSTAMQWRRPYVLLATGLIIGCAWAFVFNALFGPRFGVFYYGRVIEGLALWEGTRYQYPLYDALAMGVQMMVFTYLLGRTDQSGRSLVEAWADARASTRNRSALLSIAVFIVIGHLVYLSVFAPHLATKVMGLVTAGPTEQLFEGVPNQPL
ncbi:MAG: spirocyclase AveC family protein [Pseudomonadota bacterium]|nr:spirocyclase AveC family protein [Pseudomonadota bacterium]